MNILSNFTTKSIFLNRILFSSKIFNNSSLFSYSFRLFHKCSIKLHSSSLIQQKEDSIINIIKNKEDIIPIGEEKRKEILKQLTELQQKGYIITEKDDIVVITRKKDSRTVTVSWNPNYPLPSIKKRKPPYDLLYEDIPVTISIKHSHFSETLFFSGVIGDSHQLLLFKIYPSRISYYGEHIKFSKLTEEIQLKFYDYMEILGTGDGLASFIANYNTSRRIQNNIKQLSKIKSILSK